MTIDANTPGMFPGEDPIEMLRGMTMAFMVLLATQPNMTFEVSRETMENFAYHEYKLDASFDPVTGARTFMLTREVAVQ